MEKLGQISTSEKRGYLRDDLRLFSLCDEPEVLPAIKAHYHEFHKLMLFRGGCASYTVEGKHYELIPGDILIIGRGCIHLPEIHKGSTYKRTLLYLSPSFLREHSSAGCDLELCFNEASASGRHVLRADSSDKHSAVSLFNALEDACSNDDFGARLLFRSIAIQLVIRLGRAALGENAAVSGVIRDSKTTELLTYINSNLTADVPIDGLAEQFYMSKYHMMRRFKAETGYTIHSYILGKRLLLSRELLSSGLSATEACYQSGFHDYSAFSRAYKKHFGVSPGRERPKVPEKSLLEEQI